MNSPSPTARSATLILEFCVLRGQPSHAVCVGGFLCSCEWFFSLSSPFYSAPTVLWKILSKHRSSICNLHPPRLNCPPSKHLYSTKIVSTVSLQRPFPFFSSGRIPATKDLLFFRLCKLNVSSIKLLWVVLVLQKPNPYTRRAQGAPLNLQGWAAKGFRL